MMTEDRSTSSVVVRRVQWNTGNLYSSQGQRIVAVLTNAGEIHFHDLDRGIFGVLTEGSCAYGGKTIGPAKFELDATTAEIQRAVRAQYVGGYRYDSWSQIGRGLKWES